MHNSVRVFHDSFDGSLEHEIMKEGIEKMQTLICYRVLKAYKAGHISPAWHIFAKHQLRNDYPESMILEAIEKVKNEQK